VAVTTLALLFVFADVIIGGRRELDTAGFPDRLVSRFERARRELAMLPAGASALGMGPPVVVAARYVAECTQPADRVLSTGYYPEVPVFAGRESWQRMAVARLQRQSVPIVLTPPPPRFEEEFAADYPIVAAYLVSRYRVAGTIDAEGEPQFQVLVDRARSTGRSYAGGALPCFT
jgi:hypothetical protein